MLHTVFLRGMMYDCECDDRLRVSVFSSALETSRDLVRGEDVRGADQAEVNVEVEDVAGYSRPYFLCKDGSRNGGKVMGRKEQGEGRRSRLIKILS